MRRRPPRSTRTATLFPYSRPFRSRGGEKERTAGARAPPMLHEPAIDRPVAQLVGGVGLVQMPVVSKLMPPIAAAQADVEVAKLLGHAQFAVKILAGACAEVANQRRTVGIGHGRLAAIDRKSTRLNSSH